MPSRLVNTQRVLSLLLLLCAPISALRPPPVRRAAPPLHSRRAALQRALLLPVALGPLAAHAGSKCTCITPDNCICGEDDGSKAVGEFERQQQKEIDKIKKGGLYTKQTSSFSNYEYQDDLRPPPPPKGKGKAGAKGAKGDKPSGRDETKDLAPVKGLGSQNFADADKGEAKAKFAEIMKQKVAEREAKLGFELDADDIKELEKAQRVKYCGPQGLIGPC